MTIKFKNLPEFNKELKFFGKQKVPADQKRLFSLIALDILRRTVFRTPVDTGRARANWQTVAGPAGDSVVEGGADPLATGAQVITAQPPFSLVTIFNNVKYIVPLEFGHSQQAPRGMLRLSVAEVNSQFQKSR